MNISEWKFLGLYGLNEEFTLPNDWTEAFITVTSTSQNWATIPILIIAKSLLVTGNTYFRTGFYCTSLVNCAITFKRSSATKLALVEFEINGSAITGTTEVNVWYR